MLGKPTVIAKTTPHDNRYNWSDFFAQKTGRLILRDGTTFTVSCLKVKNGQLGLMVNVASTEEANRDVYTMRRLAIDHHVPLLTNAETGRLLLRCLSDAALKDMQPKHWSEYVKS